MAHQPSTTRRRPATCSAESTSVISGSSLFVYTERFAGTGDDESFFLPTNPGHTHSFRQRFLGVPLEDPITTTKLRDWDDRREELERSPNEWALVHLAFLASLPRTRRSADQSAPTPLWATKAELTARLAACNLTDKEFQALFRLIDSYLRLSIADEEQFRAELQRQMGETEMPYLTGIERVALQRGEEIGLQRGEEIGLRRAVLVSLEARFGPVPVQLVRLINTIVHPDTLARLIPTTLRAPDLEAFAAEVNSLHQASSNGAARGEVGP